jgi:eukaryotic-like serine/threonine-protein kinase
MSTTPPDEDADAADDDASTARRDPGGGGPDTLRATVPRRAHEPPVADSLHATVPATMPAPLDVAPTLGAPTTPPPAAIAGAGARYALGPVLGRGGMGEVRAARDPRVDRTVAVKVMRERDAGPDAVARFLREARIQGRLDHPAVVPVHDLGLDDRGRPYFAMKRLTGTTLADALAGVRSGDPAAVARWPRRLLLDRFVDICLAIEFAHARGVIHRDIKPGNLMLGDYGEAYVLDWGIARVADADLGGSATDGIAGADLGSLDSAQLAAAGATAGATADGTMLGTPGYMAPEQMMGDPIDRRADVYALGCILFELLTLAPALPAGPAAFDATLSATPHHPRDRHPDADVPPELDAACAAATAPAPATRTATARELAAAVRAYLDGDRDLAQRRALAAAHVATAIAAASTGDAGRANAMREAGSALALDRECRPAQDLLRRLLLVPPDEPPAAVRREVARMRARATRNQARLIAVVYAAFLFLLPASWALGMRAPGWLAALGVLIVANMTIAAVAARREWPSPTMFYAGLAIHGAILALVGIIAGPLLLAPTLAIGSVASFAIAPASRNLAVVIAVHLAAGAAPLLLEWTGVLEATYGANPDGSLWIQPWAFTGTPASLAAIVLTFSAVQILTTALLLGAHRRTEQRAEEQIHLTKWHLDQLLPESER